MRRARNRDQQISERKRRTDARRAVCAAAARADFAQAFGARKPHARDHGGVILRFGLAPAKVGEVADAVNQQPSRLLWEAKK